MADEEKKIKAGESEPENVTKLSETDKVETDSEVAAKAGAADTLTACQENSTETQGESEKAVEKKPDESNDEKNGENERKFTQSQVNEIAGKARADGRASALKELYSRYGVDDESGLDGILGKGMTYDELNEAYSTQGKSLREVQAENALLKTQINPTRWEDVKLILNGKGLDVTAENISGLLETHPEWLGDSVKQSSVEKAEEIAKTPSRITKLGSELSNDKDAEQKEALDRLFGFGK